MGVVTVEVSEPYCIACSFHHGFRGGGVVTVKAFEEVYCVVTIAVIVYVVNCQFPPGPVEFDNCDIA